jgi:prepilin-type N-terminal cleavage/methylation domain-containing protein
MKRTAPDKGFSLTELMIALALIGIVASFGVPQFQSYTANTALKSAAREVASDLFSARQKAVNESLSVYRITFDTGANSYTLSRTDSGVTLWTKSPATFGSAVRLTSVNFSGGSVIGFQRRGTLSAWGTLTLQNNRGSTATVTVNMTGRTYVQFTTQ